VNLGCVYNILGLANPGYNNLNASAARPATYGEQINLLTEYLFLPWLAWPVPRDIQLMGFHGPAFDTVDDIKLNSIGFTGDEMTPDKPAGVIRILTLGGSSMFNRHMTERLSNSLRQRTNKPLEILGGALRTHNSRSSLLKYRALAPYNFDYVLIYHGINDLWANDVPSDGFFDDYRQLNPWYRRGYWLDRSLIVRRIYNAYVGGESGSMTGNGGCFLESSQYLSARTFEQNIRQLIADIRQNGGVPILMTFAYSIPPYYSLEGFLNNMLGYNNNGERNQCPVEVWGSVPYVKEGLQIHNGIIRKLAAELEVPLVDQESAMGKDLNWYSDVCHFSEVGTDLFIQNITDFFATKGVI